MFPFVMLFLFIAGFAFGIPFISIIPGIYLLFKLVMFILELASDHAKEKAGFEKKTTTVHHKYNDPFYGVHEVDEERTEWVKKEPLSTLEIGTSYESFVAQKLIQSGYTNIQFTPTSGDFGADIIAIDKQGRKCCIQCKCFQGSVGVSAVQEVFSATHYYGCSVAIVITNNRFTEAAKKLASKLKVCLFEYV